MEEPITPQDFTNAPLPQELPDAEPHLPNTLTQEQIAEFSEKLCMFLCQQLAVPIDGENTPKSKETPPTISQLYSSITRMIHEFGIPAHLRGYQYMREAILQLYEDGGLMNCIATHLYPQVAAVFATSPTNVERSIRHAIDYAWEYGHLRAILADVYQGFPLMQHKPSNSELITAAADKLWLETGRLPMQI